MNTEEILMKIAKEIETKCGVGGCPCKINCDVYSYNDCIDRITAWLKEVILKDRF